MHKTENGSSKPRKKIRSFVLINKKKRTCNQEDFIIQADHGVKMKESEKLDKYLDLAMKKKMWNMKSDGDTNSNWHVGNNSRKSWKND